MIDVIDAIGTISVVLLIGATIIGVSSIAGDFLDSGPIKVIHKGVLEFANSSTLIFADGSIYSAEPWPFRFVDNASEINQTTNVNYAFGWWTTLSPLVKGEAYVFGSSCYPHFLADSNWNKYGDVSGGFLNE